jgi:hypothetical protein
MPHVSRLSDKAVRSAPIGKHHNGGVYLQVVQGSNGTNIKAGSCATWSVRRAGTLGWVRASILKSKI